MAKREVVNRGWLSNAQSSKKLKGPWKKASSLGMHSSAKYNGAREPTFAGHQYHSSDGSFQEI